MRAYTEGAKIGILAAGIVEVVLHTRFEINVDYTLSGKLQNVVMQSPWRLDGIGISGKVCFTVLAARPGRRTRSGRYYRAHQRPGGHPGAGQGNMWRSS